MDGKKAKPTTERAITVNDIDTYQIKDDVEIAKNTTSALQAQNEQMKQTIQQLDSKIHELTAQINSIPNQAIAISNYASQKSAKVSSTVDYIQKDSFNSKVMSLISSNKRLNKDVKCMKYEIKKLMDVTKEKDVQVEVQLVSSNIPDDLCRSC